MKANTLIKFRKNKLLNKIIHTLLLKKGLEIPSSVIIGENCDFPHNSVGTVIHPDTIIKDNVKIYQNVTIGSRNMKEPVLEDNVHVWAHAIVLGDITIGANTDIGAGSIVVKSIPQNCVVVPESSLIIRRNGNCVKIKI